MSRAADGATERPDVNPWVVAVAVMFGTFMVFLDTTVVNLSLPYMAGNLSASVNEATWVLTSYLAANAVILPMAGWMANYFGRKRVLRGCLVTFTIASLLCGLAPNLTTMILFRILQGLSGGAMQPLSQAVLLESFPPRDRGKAMGFWSMGIVMAPLLGPIVGGYLTDHYSWRWVFLINIPIGVLAVAMVEMFVFDPSYIRRRSERIDYRGIGLLALSIAALQIVLDKGQQDDWLASGLIRALLLIGGVGLVVFVLHELRAEGPVVDLRVFRDPTFCIGTVLVTLVGFILFASIVMVPLLMQVQLGYPPLDAGLATLPRGLGALVAFPIVGELVARVDARRLLFAGMVLGAFGSFWIARLSGDLSALDLAPPLFIQGLALGLLFVPLTTVTMDRIANENMGNATSLFNVTRNFGSSIGIATAATLLERRQVYHQAVLGSHVDPYSPLVQARLEDLAAMHRAAGAEPAAAAEAALSTLRQVVAEGAGMLSFLDVFRVLGWLFLVMLPLAFLMRRPYREEPPAPG